MNVIGDVTMPMESLLVEHCRGEVGPAREAFHVPNSSTRSNSASGGVETMAVGSARRSSAAGTGARISAGVK
jgi:hypothetical protein